MYTRVWVEFLQKSLLWDTFRINRFLLTDEWYLPELEQCLQKRLFERFPFVNIGLSAQICTGVGVVSASLVLVSNHINTFLWADMWYVPDFEQCLQKCKNISLKGFCSLL